MSGSNPSSPKIQKRAFSKQSLSLHLPSSKKTSVAPQGTSDRCFRNTAPNRHDLLWLSQRVCWPGLLRNYSRPHPLPTVFHPTRRALVAHASTFVLDQQQIPLLRFLSCYQQCHPSIHLQARVTSHCWRYSFWPSPTGLSAVRHPMKKVTSLVHPDVKCLRGLLSHTYAWQIFTILVSTRDVLGSFKPVIL